MTKLTKEQCLDLVIPKQLINRAKKYRPCKESIDWLNKKPRTIRDLIRYHKGWIEWFINHVPVGRVYREILHTAYPEYRTWFKNGKLHRDNDLPAMINSDGSISWYRNGKLHRDNDEPALITEYGSRYWFKNGKLHRDNDEPALITDSGSRHWYKKGKLHRDNDLPAVIYDDGYMSWYKNGVYIRSERS